MFPSRLLSVSLARSPSARIGVGHARDSVVSVRSPPRRPWLCSESSAVAVGQREQPFAPVRSAELSRREYASRNAEPHASQAAGDDVKAERKVAGDVLEENKSRFALPDDALHLRPEVARVSSAESVAGEAEGLARVARSDEIHDSAPRAAVEGSKVVPDRSRSQAALAHARDQDRGGKGLPLHVTHGAVGVAEGELDAQLQPADSGT